MGAGRGWAFWANQSAAAAQVVLQALLPQCVSALVRLGRGGALSTGWSAATA